MIVNWTVFANLYNTLIVPLLAQLQAMLGNVCSTIQPIALAMVTLWLGFAAFDVSNGTKTVQQMMRDFFIAGMVIGALQMGQYTQYVSDLFLQAVPNTIGAALGGTTSPVAGLDTVLNSAVTAASKTYEALPTLALKTIPLCFSVIVFIVIAAVSIGYTFAVYMTAVIISVVAVVVGPVFLALAAIPFTRRFAAGWFGVLVGGCATQLMALAVIQLLTGAETRLMQQTVVSVAASNSNGLGMLWGLLQCGLLLALCSAVVKKIPDIAREIAGGVYYGAASFHTATFGAAAAAAGASVGAARGAAGAIGTHASRQIGAGAVRLSTPVGRSLSEKS